MVSCCCIFKHSLEDYNGRGSGSVIDLNYASVPEVKIYIRWMRATFISQLLKQGFLIQWNRAKSWVTSFSEPPL